VRGVEDMSFLKQYIGKIIEIEVSSKKSLVGVLVDYGSDIAILYGRNEFYYIPFMHIQSIKECKDNTEDFGNPEKNPIDQNEQMISCRKILTNAKGIFVEIYVTGKQSIYGYITSVLNNYFVFYSPVYKTMYVPINHLKWLIPYHLNETPYALSKERLPLSPVNISNARTFEEQLKKFEGEIVVFDLGENPNKIGMVKKFENNIVELVTGREETVYWNLNHLKTVHLT
jgi:hypothetical protein